MLWFKWHALNIWLKLLSLFGIKKKAVDDVKAAGKAELHKYAEGAGLNFENEVASKYFEFWDRDFNPNKLNVYFFLIVISVIVLVYRIFFPLGPTTDLYLLYGALSIVALMVVLFVIELLKKSEAGKLIDDEEYSEAEDWMHYVGDESRAPHPPWWAVIVVVVGLLIEGFAISVIVISLIGDFTKNESQIAGFILGVVITSVMAWLVHKAGESLYKEKHRKELYDVIVKEGGVDSYVKKENELESDRRYKSITYDVLQNQQVTFNVDDKGYWSKYWSVIVGVVVVLSVAGLAFLARAEFNKDLMRLQASMLDDSTEEFSFLPEDVVDQQDQNKKDILEEELGLNTKAMYLGLALLTLVFIVINYFGAYVGYGYCFYHDRSKMAYKIIKEYERQKAYDLNYDDYMTMARQRVEKKANQFFAKYHQVLMDKAGLAQALHDALNKRGSYEMKFYVAEKMQKKGFMV